MHTRKLGLQISLQVVGRKSTHGSEFMPDFLSAVKTVIIEKVGLASVAKKALRGVTDRKNP
jgi:hypothetical protein